MSDPFSDSSSSLDASYIVVGPQNLGQTVIFQPTLVERAPRPQPPTVAPEEKPPSQHPSLNAAYTPGSTNSSAHDWSTRTKLRTEGRHFLDQWNRVCLPRGVNLSASCKAPVNHNPETFPAGYQTVTFVGRPFPLEDAHEHLARLQRWGLTFVRFLITWEAVEHAGPGQYDDAYLAYIRDLLSLFPKYNISAFVSMHQDVWSRYSGGSGAPAWTLEAVGFDLHALEETGAARLSGVRGKTGTDERGVWPTGYQKLAASTMATCFWGGDTFAPKLKVQGKVGKNIGIQDFLQGCFLDAWERVLRSVGDLEAVIGFEMMNEPHRGYIDLPSLHEFDYRTELHLHDIPSALQSFTLGAGHPTRVAHWTRSFPMPTRLTSYVTRNEKGRKAWREDGPTGGRCLWEMHGVWGWDLNKKEGVPLRENYFVRDPQSGKKIDWYTDLYYPFLKRWDERIRRVAGRNKIVFAEPIPNEFCPKSWTPEHQLNQMVFAPHWYDLNALFAKSFGNFSINVQGLAKGMFLLKAFYWGQQDARDNYRLQLRNIIEAGYRSLGERPVFIGETGVPMDMNEREAFRSGDFIWQEKMMDALVSGLEQNLVGFTLWNYNPENDDEEGDFWNGENFSWFSNQRARRRRAIPSSDQTDASLDEGGRILTSVVRPYPAKIAGIPLRFEYEVNEGSFVFEWANPASDNSRDVSSPDSDASVSSPPLNSHPPLLARETEIFFPSLLARGRTVVVRGASKYSYDEARQTLFILQDNTSPGHVHRIHAMIDPIPEPRFELTTHWDDFQLYYLAFSLLVLAISYFSI